MLRKFWGFGSAMEVLVGVVIVECGVILVLVGSIWIPWTPVPECEPGPGHEPVHCMWSFPAGNESTFVYECRGPRPVDVEVRAVVDAEQLSPGVCVALLPDLTGLGRLNGLNAMQEMRFILQPGTKTDTREQAAERCRNTVAARVGSGGTMKYTVNIQIRSGPGDYAIAHGEDEDGLTVRLEPNR